MIDRILSVFSNIYRTGPDRKETFLGGVAYMTDEELLLLAKEYRFDCAAPMDVSKLEVLEDVRKACEVNRCGAYNKTWACPPAFGDLEESRKILQKYKRGLLVQSVQILEDDFDWEGIQELGKRHGENFQELYARLRKDYPDLLALGAGGCRRCEECTYPDAPCRFPDKMTYSMEGFGLFVTKVCQDCGIPYNHGRGTMTYSGCFLIE